jgi:hypothetical protein
MKIKQIALSCVLLLSTAFGANPGLAQEPYDLTEGDVTNFIRSFPSISSDFDKLDIVYDSESNDFNLPEGVDYLQEIDRVVKKHGYADFSDFSYKVSAIIGCYTAITLDQEATGAQSEIQDAIAEIESSEYYTDEQKEQMKAALLQSAEALAGLAGTLASPENIAVVRPYIQEIASVLDDAD